MLQESGGVEAGVAACASVRCPPTSAGMCVVLTGMANK